MITSAAAQVEMIRKRLVKRRRFMVGTTRDTPMRLTGTKKIRPVLRAKNNTAVRIFDGGLSGRRCSVSNKCPAPRVAVATSRRLTRGAYFAPAAATLEAGALVFW